MSDPDQSIPTSTAVALFAIIGVLGLAMLGFVLFGDQSPDPLHPRDVLHDSPSGDGGPEGPIQGTYNTDTLGRLTPPRRAIPPDSAESPPPPEPQTTNPPPAKPAETEPGATSRPS